MKKPPGYHLDLLVCGVFVYPICCIIGLPFTHAATVRSLTHLISLTTYKHIPLKGGGSKQVADSVVEQRGTNLIIHIIMSLSLLLSAYLKHIPKAVLFGIFLYMGISAMTGVQLFDRMHLWAIWEKENYPRYRFVTRVPTGRLHLYTFLQFMCLVILYALKSIQQVAVIFPFFIGSLIYVRKLFKYIFTPEELAELDAHEDLELDGDDDDETPDEGTPSTSAREEGEHHTTVHVGQDKAGTEVEMMPSADKSGDGNGDENTQQASVASYCSIS